MAANGDIAGGTADTPCELWQRRSDGSYTRPVTLPLSPNAATQSASSIWSSGRSFVVGGEQLTTDTSASIWSPKPSLQTNKLSEILGLGGTRAHLFAVGGDTTSAFCWQVEFNASRAAHLGVLHRLNPPGTGKWKAMEATAVTTDARGNMVAIGDGTPGGRNPHAEALFWHGTKSALLQSALPSRPVNSGSHQHVRTDPGHGRR